MTQVARACPQPFPQSRMVPWLLYTTQMPRCADAERVKFLFVNDDCLGSGIPARSTHIVFCRRCAFGRQRQRCIPAEYEYSWKRSTHSHSHESCPGDALVQGMALGATPAPPLVPSISFGDCPIPQISVTGKELTEFQTIDGALSVSLASWIVILSVSESPT